MKRILQVLLFSLILFGGCGEKKLPVRLATAPGEPAIYQIPVNFDPPEVPFDWDGSPVAEFNIPPSSTTTHLYVKAKKRPFLPKKNEQAFESYSDNEKVSANQTTTTPWWWWVVIILAVAIAIIFMLSWLQKKFTWAFKAFTFLRKVVGL